MAKHTYKTYLSVKSVQHTIRQLEAYKKRLDSQIEEFCQEVAKAGMATINAVLSEHVETSVTIGSVKLITEGSASSGRYKALVQVTSDAILFLEFGSGRVGQGTAPHAGEHHMGSGTYPSEVPIQDPHGRYENWNNPNGWYYYGEDGKLYNTKGMAAVMPMYQGGKEMELRLAEIAKKVFR